jgi:hypothetical protein
MGRQKAVDRGLKAAHAGPSRHQFRYFFAGLFALLEIGRDCTADQHREMIAHRHRVHHLMGGENDRKAVALRLIHDAQHMGRLLAPKGAAVGSLRISTRAPK